MSELDFSNLSTLSVVIENHIAHIRLCRPEAMNTMVPAFWTELPDTVRKIDAHAAARVIVVSSTGKHFCAGMDLAVFQQMSTEFGGEPARRAEHFRQGLLQLQDAFSALEHVRIPVLAAVHGGAIGGAVDLLCACDCRYATQDAYFTIKETQIGMTADVGTLQRIHHVMPQGLARELAYTGRNFGAVEALQFGFINQVFPDQAEMLAAVMTIAAQIAENSPMAVAGTKEMLNYARDHPVENSLKYMANWQGGMFQMPDIMEAMTAKMEQRAPTYEDLRDTHNQMRKKAGAS